MLGLALFIWVHVFCLHFGWRQKNDFFTRIIDQLNHITCQKNWVVLFACVRVWHATKRSNEEIRSEHRSSAHGYQWNFDAHAADKQWFALRNFAFFLRSSFKISLIASFQCLSASSVSFAKWIHFRMGICRVTRAVDSSSNNNCMRWAQQHTKHSFHLTCVKGLMINYNITLNSIVYDKI